jgi:hypothetical protein
MPVTPVRPPSTWNTDSSQILNPKERQDGWVFGVLPLLVIPYFAILSYGFYLLHSTSNLPDITGLMVAMASTFLVIALIWLIYRFMSPNILILTSLSLVPFLILILAFTTAFLVDRDFGNAFILVCIVFMNAFKYVGFYAGEYRVPTAFAMHVVHKSPFSLALLPFTASIILTVLMFYALNGWMHCTTPWLESLSIAAGISLHVALIFILASYTRMRSSAAMIRQCLTLPRTTHDSHKFIFTMYITYFTIDGWLRSLPLQLFLLLTFKTRLGALIAVFPDISAGMPALLHNENYFKDISFKNMFLSRIVLGEAQVYDAVFYAIILASLIVQLTFHLVGWKWVIQTGHLTISWILLQVLVAPLVARIPSAVRTYQHDNRSFLSNINDESLATEIASNVMPQAE